ncbi:nSTAND1 domain-containing NTPase [Streptomyces phaeochromogenes]
MGRREKPLDPEAGPVQRFAHELRMLREQAGRPTYREMARLSGYSATALSQAAAGEQLPSPAVVRAFAEVLDADPEEWERRWREADEEVRTSAAEEDDAAPPYRGLARFEPYDSELFFGRDTLVGELLELARGHRIAAVFGPSGSGKSSLLRAGLIPALRQASGDERPAVIRVLTPGERPAHTHAGALAPMDGPLETWVIVDQFEELFTLCHDSGERDRFLEALLAGCAPGNRLRVVVAVRGDFYGHCAAHRELADAVSRANLLVGPMSRDELRATVTGPATATGLNVERELTSRIVDEVSGRPGALPMLSHALLETWRRRRGRLLTVAAYEEAGGVSGAVAATAEQMYAELSETQARTARRVLLRLIVPGEASADTRRPAERAELGEEGDVAVVVERLTAARLVTLDDGIVELAHEALITGWPRLADWIDEDRERLREQHRLGEAARAWEELGRDPGALYRGTRLARAEEVFAGPAAEDDLTGGERTFLTTSLDARDAQGAADARAVRKARAFTAAVAALLVVALAGGLFAWQQHRTGEQEAAKAAARRIASVADSLRSTDPRTAALLGVAAWKIAPLTESRSALLGALDQTERDAFVDPETGKDVRRFLARDGRTLLSVAGRRVSLWDVTSRHRTATYRLPRDMEVTGVGPDGRTLDLVGADGEWLWDLKGRQTTAELKDEFVLGFGADGRSYLTAQSEGTGPVRLRRTTDGRVLFTERTPGDLTGAAVGGDSRVAVLCPADRPPQVWDTSRGTRLSGAWDTSDKTVCGSGSGADGGERAARLSPDGKRMAILAGHEIRAWDLADGRLLADISAQDAAGFTDADFSPDGRFLATADAQALTVWRLDAPDGPVFRVPLGGEKALGLAWTPGKDQVLRYLDSATVHTYDLTTVLAPTWQRDPADAAALSPDGAALATVTRSGRGYRFTLRSTETGAVLAHADLGALSGGYDPTPLLAYSPDARALVVGATDPASGATDQRFTVWDVRAHKVRSSFTLPGSAGNPAGPVALGADGRTLLAARRQDGTPVTELWDTGRGRRTQTLPGVTGDSMAVRPDRRLIVDSRDQYLDAESGRATDRALAAGRDVTALAFSPDGRRLAVGDSSGRITLWDGDLTHRTGVIAGTSQNNVREVSALSFSPDGAVLAVGGADGTVQLWDTASQRPLGTRLPAPDDGIHSIAFNENGDTVFVAGAHTPLQRYPVGPDRAVALVCRRAGGGLTEAEWHAYVPDAPYRHICPG